MFFFFPRNTWEYLHTTDNSPNLAGSAWCILSMWFKCYKIFHRETLLTNNYEAKNKYAGEQHCNYTQIPDWLWIFAQGVKEKQDSPWDEIPNWGYFKSIPFFPVWVFTPQKNLPRNIKNSDCASRWNSVFYFGTQLFSEFLNVSLLYHTQQYACKLWCRSGGT